LGGLLVVLLVGVTTGAFGGRPRRGGVEGTVCWVVRTVWTWIGGAGCCGGATLGGCATDVVGATLGGGASGGASGATLGGGAVRPVGCLGWQAEVKILESWRMAVRCGSET
jgi:hypothetical protein